MLQDAVGERGAELSPTLLHRHVVHYQERFLPFIMTTRSFSLQGSISRKKRIHGGTRAPWYNKLFNLRLPSPRIQSIFKKIIHHARDLTPQTKQRFEIFLLLRATLNKYEEESRLMRNVQVAADPQSDPHNQNRRCNGHRALLSRSTT